MRLHEFCPCISFQVPIPAFAHPVIVTAILKLAYAIVLAAERDQGANRGIIATLDVGAKKLAALGKTKGVDGGGAGEDGVHAEVVADLLNLFGEITEEGCGAVRRWVLVEVNEVGVGSRVS